MDMLLAKVLLVLMVILFFIALHEFLEGEYGKLVGSIVCFFVLLHSLNQEVHAQDNDDLAFEFINTGAEAMSVAYECKDKLTAKEWSIVQDKSMANVVLDPRDYCESLKEELKKLK